MLSDDKQTIQQVLAGDPAAFADLVHRYQRRLMGLMVHACGDQQLAEDMTQEAFARAFQKLHTYAGHAQFYTWLARIAMNLLASNRRRKRLENQVDREGLDPAVEKFNGGEAPERRMIVEETQAAVRHAISQLDPERQAVLLLRDFDGLDYDAIASVLEIPIGTVRSRLHRARLDLKELLQQRASELGLSTT